MELKKQDLILIKMAKSLAGQKKVSGGIVKEVGCALITNKGTIFTGTSMDLHCGIGFCGEHSAISNMISHSDETEIDTIVACSNKRVMYPCGRCRELIELINVKNRDITNVIIPGNKKVKLQSLLPGNWM
jgi:cytidine deaminase